ncbi:hypothetical protein U1Q18_017232 [Sarracenia purpurea var. burkii]
MCTTSEYLLWLFLCPPLHRTPGLVYKEFNKVPENQMNLPTIVEQDATTRALHQVHPVLLMQNWLLPNVKNIVLMPTILEVRTMLLVLLALFVGSAQCQAFA